jgi:hypothetical protein
MLEGLLGSKLLWAHLHELALSDSLLLVLLCPELESDLKKRARRVLTASINLVQ